MASFLADGHIELDRCNWFIQWIILNGQWFKRRIWNMVLYNANKFRSSLHVLRPISFSFITQSNWYTVLPFSTQTRIQLSHTRANIGKYRTIDIFMHTTKIQKQSIRCPLSIFNLHTQFLIHDDYVSVLEDTNNYLQSTAFPNSLHNHIWNKHVWLYDEYNILGLCLLVPYSIYDGIKFWWVIIWNHICNLNMDTTTQ